MKNGPTSVPVYDCIEIVHNYLVGLILLRITFLLLYSSQRLRQKPRNLKHIRPVIWFVLPAFLYNLHQPPIRITSRPPPRIYIRQLTLHQLLLYLLILPHIVKHLEASQQPVHHISKTKHIDFFVETSITELFRRSKITPALPIDTVYSTWDYIYIYLFILMTYLLLMEYIPYICPSIY